MKTFFVSKYPVVTHFDKDGAKVISPEGTVFTIVCINGGLFELSPIKKIPAMIAPLMVSAEMLNTGFTQQDIE